eukprot:CCRYP_009715-RA/>CCRYP_009715-RA protein AED:0.07 eAED:0.07 QI:181/1/1/1/0/0/2/744/459
MAYLGEQTADMNMEYDVPPPLTAPPPSPRLSRTTELLARFPGLTIPEAMRAAKYSLDESQDAVLQSAVEEIMRQVPAAKEKKSRRKPGSQQPAPAKRAAPALLEIDPSRLPPDITIAAVRPKNASGRCLCRVEGCRKLDQANNDGFCRAHFNLIKIADDDQHEGGAGGVVEPWTCDCGNIVGANQKRCGNCHRWKDGVRTNFRKEEKKQVVVIKDPQVFWTCDCGNEVPEPKTRCGKCHHWRAGKRVGGWKLGAKAENGADAVDDGIDRSQDWMCCGEVIKAAKTRCGKCRKWRGGKRQIRWSYGSVTDNSALGLQSHENAEDGEGAVDLTLDWVCKNENCKTVNKGSKRRCSNCFSWRFSRKKARPSDAAVNEMAKDEEDGEMTLDQLDKLVTEEIKKEGYGGEEEVPENGEHGVENEGVLYEERIDGEEALNSGLLIEMKHEEGNAQEVVGEKFESV